VASAAQCGLCLDRWRLTSSGVVDEPTPAGANRRACLGFQGQEGGASAQAQRQTPQRNVPLNGGRFAPPNNPKNKSLRLSAAHRVVYGMHYQAR